MLIGEKVKLRPIEREDLKRLHELEQNVELMTLAGGDWRPVPLAAFEKSFDKHLEDKSDEQNWFGIEADGKLIGDIGLHHINRQESTTQFGISIGDPDYVGKGYGRDAIRVLLRWAFHNQNWRRVWLETLGTNERAIRSYQACGFVIEGRLRDHAFYNGQYVDLIVMGLLCSECKILP